ncbi:MAG: hypothetical protein KDD92_20380 [Caldilineaceae bacterium]|nr:hypothetical protein [Caldilineaceae bacterium]
MNSQTFFVPKSTGTLTDTLLAYGAATVLEQFIRQHSPNANVSLSDQGSFFVIESDEGIEEEWLTDPTQQPVRYVVSGEKYMRPERFPDAAARSVDDAWETLRQFNELREQLQTQKVSGNELEQRLLDRKPAPDWTVVTYLGDYRMQAQAIHNGLIEQWMAADIEFPGLNMGTLLELTKEPGADWDAIAAEWKGAVKESDFKDTVTASQLFNPHMGKGQNRTKANKLALGNEKVFWLPELLKVAGLWAAAAPTKIANADMRKTYVLAPQHMQMSDHRKVFADFRDRLRNESAIKQDIVAATLYAQALLEQSVENDEVDIFDDGPLSNVVNGMHVVTYQLLSANSYTMMNLAFLGLPDWMPHIVTSDDALEFIDVLEEHRERIRAIDEERSEGYTLLQRYRDFLSGNDLPTFFTFLAGYSSYLISELDRSHFYVKPFTETNLRRLIAMTEQNLSEIVEADGFRNIAYAIRMSTLIPLYLGRNKSRFDVRYGLGQDLMRKAQYPDDFAQALAEFMQSYNDETMRVHERTKGKARRKLITTGDIEEIIDLIDEHGSKTVCNLLVAFGYARDPREQTEEEASDDPPADNT